MLPLNDGQVEKSSFHGRYLWDVAVVVSSVVWKRPLGAMIMMRSVAHWPCLLHACD